MALENIRSNNGKITDKDITLSVQKVKHIGPCEVSFPGFSFVDIYTVAPQVAPELKWFGDWKHPILFSKATATIETEKRKKIDNEFLSSENAGDYLETSFVGTCIYVQGNLHENSGILEAYVDGKLMQTRDMYIRKVWNGHRQATAVWITGLSDDRHTLRVVVTGLKNSAATGTEIQIGRVVSYSGLIPLPTQI